MKITFVTKTNLPNNSFTNVEVKHCFADFIVCSFSGSSQ